MVPRLQRSIILLTRRPTFAYAVPRAAAEGRSAYRVHKFFPNHTHTIEQKLLLTYNMIMAIRQVEPRQVAAGRTVGCTPWMGPESDTPQG